jgi:SET domain-containing protein
MLQIAYYIKESTIPNAGYGIFTAQDIKKGDIVWKFNKDTMKILTENDIESINNEEIKKMILKHTYKIKNYYYYDLTDGKFANHSDDPNLIETNDINSCSVASRDIKKDEELFSDYFSYDENASMKLSSSDR